VAVLALTGLLFGSVKPGRYVSATVPANASCTQVGNALHEDGVVGSTLHWELEVCAAGNGDNLKPGTYRLRQHESYDVIVRTLQAGPQHAVPAVLKLNIPPGLRIRDIERLFLPQAAIATDAYRSAIIASSTPRGFRPTGTERITGEGFLYPAAYDVRRGDAKGLVAAQHEAFRRAVAGVDFSYARKRHLTRYDVLIIASMIEREVAYPPERAKVAAVIYNRLHRQMPLAIDATLQYAAGSWRPLTESDLQNDNPFNSRLHTGLPPTPISNPGLAAIEAAAHPAQTDALYYVAIPHDPLHRQFFTSSYQAFLQFQKKHPAS
jgi:uncharacterized YceG family protein